MTSSSNVDLADVKQTTQPPARVGVSWQQGLAAYLPERHRAWGERNAKHLPVTLATAVVALLAATTSQATAFIDEALYINAGYDYLNYWFAGGPYIDHATVLSGFPVLYPVLAAMLDSIGGLWLVRALSLVLMVTTIVLTARTSHHLFGYRAGMFTAAALGFVGPVVFLSQLATHDALSLTLLVTGIYLGVTRTSFRSAAMVGVVVAIATLVKYTGAAFVPAVLALTLLTGDATRRNVARTAIALLTATALLGSAYLLASDTIIAGMWDTTFARTEGFGVIAPATTQQLLGLIGANVGLLVFVAAFGALTARSWRFIAVAVTLVGAAALLPTGQLILGELSSFEKHLGYSAVFLAPLAGKGLDRLSRGTFMLAPPILLLVTMLLVADTRAVTLVFWGDVEPVLEIIEEDPTAGIYLSSAATTFKYHARDLEQITWIETFDFWDTTPEGHERIRSAVDAERFERVILRGDDTGNPAQDEAQGVLIDALDNNPAYDFERTEVGPAAWRIWTRTDSRPVDLEPTPNERATTEELTPDAPTPTDDPRAARYRDIQQGDVNETIARWQSASIGLE